MKYKHYWFGVFWGAGATCLASYIMPLSKNEYLGVGLALIAIGILIKIFRRKENDN